jgi:hypothetical protein
LTCRWQWHSVKPSCRECSTIVEQAETQLRVVVPIEEEEEASKNYKYKQTSIKQHAVYGLENFMLLTIAIIVLQLKCYHRIAGVL